MASRKQWFRECRLTTTSILFPSSKAKSTPTHDKAYSFCEINSFLVVKPIGSVNTKSALMTRRTRFMESEANFTSSPQILAKSSWSISKSCDIVGKTLIKGIRSKFDRKAISKSQNRIYSVRVPHKIPRYLPKCSKSRHQPQGTKKSLRKVEGLVYQP